LPNKEIPKRTDAKSKILHDGLELNSLNLHDLAVATVRSLHILGKLREEISKAVSESKIMQHILTYFYLHPKQNLTRWQCSCYNSKELTKKSLLLCHEQKTEQRRGSN